MYASWRRRKEEGGGGGGGEEKISEILRVFG